jgi:outer membrane protein OmpA-like peptidoglycan-associated protein
MKKLCLIFLLVSGSFLTIIGQNKAFKKDFMDAEYYRLTENFSTALDYYENLLAMDQDNSNLQFLCGYCALKSNAYINKTLSYLEKAVKSVSPDYKEGSYKERNAPPEAYFNLARAFHIRKDFDKAIEYYEKFRDMIDNRKFADIEYVNNYIKSCEFAKTMINNPIEARYSKVSNTIPLANTATNPVISGNDSVMIYSVSKPSGKNIMMITRQKQEWSEPKLLNYELGLSGNAYPVSLSFDGTELYLVCADYFESDIYVSHYKNKRWSKSVILSKPVNSRYFETHACISGDGKWLYFTSDRPGGFGGLDIYRSTRISGDEWGKPENLGSDINTYYNEETPFLTKNDTRLYFSSQGHTTIGGYDIFYSDLREDGNWKLPDNLGYPVNTGGDDLFFNPGWYDQMAYYSMIIDSISNNPSIYSVRITPFKNLLAIGVSPEGHEVKTRISENDSLLVNNPTNQKVSFASLGVYYILNNILFDYDDYHLNEKASRDVERIYFLMGKFPEIGIELTGHSDARGLNEYNKKLSQKRAESIEHYLIEKGINPDRISVFASGESDPVAINQYEDGTDAPEGRRLNRHVSVKVTNLKDEKIHVSDIFVPDELIPKKDLSFSVLLMRTDKVIDTIPDKILNEEVSMICTGKNYLYSAGQFEHKADASRYLNEILDLGYNNAQIVERRKLEQMILDSSGEDPFSSVIFTIQVMALKNPRDISWFRNLDNIQRIEGKDGFHRYICGKFHSIEEALIKLPTIRKKGYKDAFIVPLSRYNELSMINKH